MQRLAHAQGRRDEVPNQELARDLVRRKDRAARIQRVLKEVAG